jgi:hypothetical protein
MCKATSEPRLEIRPAQVVLSQPAVGGIIVVVAAAELGGVSTSIPIAFRV